MAAKKTLDDLLAEEDDLGLLDVKSLGPKAASDEARVVQQFDEINAFIDKHGFAPCDGPAGRKASVNERMLQLRLKTYRESADLAERLRPHDRHGLLAATEPPPPDPQSLDDILDMDDDLLTAPGDDIFEMRHARAAGDLARPDKVSERKPCADFDRFKPLFDACAADLAAGKRKSMRFINEQEINAGDFYILNGVTAFVAEVNHPHVRSGKPNARLRVIFENGTEGDNLLRSLARSLYKDPNGRRVSDPESGPLYGGGPATVAVASAERVMGHIYIVRSLSPLPEIKRLDGGLYKVGCTVGTVEARIRGAADDPTFLLAPVHPVRSFQCVNLNPAKVEALLHRFFAAARLDIELKDRFGKPYRPREWFLLPLPVIEEAVRRLLDGSILRYRYDARACGIVAQD